MAARRSLKIILPIYLLTLSLAEAKAQFKSLDEYISAAEANSPVLKDYNARLGINRMDSMLAVTAFKPQVNFDASALYPGQYGSFGYDQAITNGGNYEAIVSVTQQFTPFRQNTLNKLISSSQRESITNEAAAEDNDLKRQVTQAYLNTCLLQQQATFYRQNDTFLLKEEVIVKALAQKGLYKISDCYALLVEDQSEKIQIASLLADLTKSFSDLNTLCGITDTVQYELTIPHIAPYTQTDYRQLRLYKKYQADSAALAEQNQLADALYKPKLWGYADAGVEAIAPGQAYRNFGNSLGLNLSIPIYDGHKRAIAHQSLKYSEDSRLAYEGFFIKNYNTKVKMLAKEIEEEDRLVTQYRNEEKDVNAWVNINDEELGAGNISVTDFLLSLRKELDVKSELAQALINQQLLQNEYNYWNY